MYIEHLGTHPKNEYKCHECGKQFQWEVLMWFDSEAAARVSGAAETVDYFG